jgi:hypothetical protein
VFNLDGCAKYTTYMSMSDVCLDTDCHIVAGKPESCYLYCMILVTALSSKVVLVIRILLMNRLPFRVAA